MKTLYYIFCILLCISCSNKETFVTLTNGPQKQSVKAAQTAAECVCISARDKWFIEIIETTPDKIAAFPNWITVSPDSGNAGSHELSITLEQNSSSNHRSADIVIFCKEDQLKIHIAQSRAE